MKELNERQLEILICVYDRIVHSNTALAACLQLDLNLNILLGDGLIEFGYYFVGEALTGGYNLTRKARKIVERRAGLRLVCELLSRVDRTMPTDSLRDIVDHIPFKELPQLLSCDDEYIRELAVAHMRKKRRSG